jgi:hypothetical protein
MARFRLHRVCAKHVVYYSYVYGGLYNRICKLVDIENSVLCSIATVTFSLQPIFRYVIVETDYYPFF